ncbi:CPA1 family monovalent cation:H+ antiporter [Povalibacter uvarum]|uniref:CPA1 family monovalent cation:H+ antiporter n=1 Tax=Povalibacter uvarum TaxID=732238 RepID=A0A841HPK8_9GAMM|nr:Na+/H+ antiporter [Povalibacter uvarum]MBB6095261.1 CPA1 family monovalent cation:H+ antiporter [Povalibacter uvarum]
MPNESILSIELVALLLLLLVIGLSALARRLRIPYPILLVLGGLVLGFFPLVPPVVLDPDLVFLVLLPPLLFAAAYATSWARMRANMLSICLLAFGLVGLTVIGGAAIGHLILPGFDWRMGLVLGAVVSTTDALAATSIARRLRLPKRAVDIIEGESLINDATGLLALNIALGLIVSGQMPGVFEASWKLVYLVGAAILIGIVLGRVLHLLLRRIDEPSIAISLSIAAPYLAYLAAENLQASGVLATVTCGVYLGNRDSAHFNATARITHTAVWETLAFILNGVAFVLIGLQLPWILDSIAQADRERLWFVAALFAVALIVLRIVWVYPGAWLVYVIQRHALRQPETLPSWRSTLVIGWSGMRGVVALAAAIALPHTLDNGEPFPGRNIIIVMTFTVILVTLVGQGLTLPPLIRALGLSSRSRE